MVVGDCRRIPNPLSTSGRSFLLTPSRDARERGKGLGVRAHRARMSCTILAAISSRISVPPPASQPTLRSSASIAASGGVFRRMETAPGGGSSAMGRALWMRRSRLRNAIGWGLSRGVQKASAPCSRMACCRSRWASLGGRCGGAARVVTPTFSIMACTMPRSRG